MFLAEEGRNFSPLHQISFDWVLGTTYAPEYSHQPSNRVFFYLCTPTEQTIMQKFCSKPTFVPRERDLHVFAWEALVPFSGLGQKTVRKGLSHWLHQVTHFPELQSWEGLQNPVANPWQINPIYLTHRQKVLSHPRRPCQCPREEGTALRTGSGVTTPTSNTQIVLLPWCAARSPDCLRQTQTPGKSNRGGGGGSKNVLDISE